jgi:hypothetical protein
MLGGGLVFIYDLIPLVAAYQFSKKLPDLFNKATMRLSETKVKIISVIGVCILIGQGALSFSDIDKSGWILVLAYILLVLIYIKYRAPYNDRASRQAISEK